MREIKFRLRDWKQMHYDDPDRHPWDLCNPYEGLADHLVLMQYAWLKDCNDKEIYEGDILQRKWTDERFSVTFRDWAYYTEWHARAVTTEPQLWEYLEEFDCFVIWNVSENYDLVYDY